MNRLVSCDRICWAWKLYDCDLFFIVSSQLHSRGGRPLSEENWPWIPVDRQTREQQLGAGLQPTVDEWSIVHQVTRNVDHQRIFASQCSSHTNNPITVPAKSTRKTTVRSRPTHRFWRPKSCPSSRIRKYSTKTIRSFSRNRPARRPPFRAYTAAENLVAKPIPTSCCFAWKVTHNDNSIESKCSPHVNCFEPTFRVGE